MKKILVMLMLALSVSVLAFAEKQVIAVWDISNVSGTYMGDRVATDFKAELTNVLVNSGMYSVVERGQLNSVLREFGFQQSGMVDPETAVEIGKMSGAGLTFVGSVVTATVGKVDNFVYDSIKAKVKLNYKVIDNKTGMILDSNMVEGNTSVMDNRGHRANKEMLVYSAVKEAVEKVKVALDNLNVLSGVVIKVNKDVIYINLGSEQGVHVGDNYVAYGEGDVLRDPCSGEILGVEDKKVALLKITEVMPRYSKAIIKKSNGDLTVNCKVRKAKRK